MRILADSITIPFNDWLKKNAIFVALAVAAILLIIIGTLFILSKKKKR